MSAQNLCKNCGQEITKVQTLNFYNLCPACVRGQRKDWSPKNIGKLIKAYRKQIILVTGGLFIALSVWFFILGAQGMEKGLIYGYGWGDAEQKYNFSFISSTIGWIIFSIGLSMKRFNVTKKN